LLEGYQEALNKVAPGIKASEAFIVAVNKIRENPSLPETSY